MNLSTKLLEIFLTIQNYCSLLRMEDVIITSSRLQPLHHDHVAFWEHIQQSSDRHLIVCILRDVNQDAAPEPEEDAETYQEYIKWTQLEEHNPLPEWHRRRLAEIAVHNNSTLQDNTTVMFRDRPDLFWEDSLRRLPESRTWAFNVTKSDFDSTKPDFYQKKGETVERMEFGKPDGYEGHTIRQQLRDGDRDLSFLPEQCHSYFKEYCQQYFVVSNSD